MKYCIKIISLSYIQKWFSEFLQQELHDYKITNKHRKLHYLYDNTIMHFKILQVIDTYKLRNKFEDSQWNEYFFHDRESICIMGSLSSEVEQDMIIGSRSKCQDKSKFDSDYRNQRLKAQGKLHFTRKPQSSNSTKVLKDG